MQTICSQNARWDYYDGTAVLLVICSGVFCNAVTAAVCSLCLLYLLCFFFFSPLGKLAGRAMYFTSVNFFFFLLWAKLSQYLLHRFSLSFYQIKDICVNFLDPVHFFRFLKGRCHGNQFCVVSKTQTMCDFCNFYTIWKRVGYRWQIWNSFFNISREGRCHGNQFSGKNGAKLPTPLHLSFCQSKTEWDIVTSMRVNSTNDASISCKKYRELWSSNSRENGAHL